MWYQKTACLLHLFFASCLSLRTLEPPPPTPMSRNTPVEGWVDVRLNHFMAFNNDTFKMRYFYNNEFSQTVNTSIVIFVGGEWGISPSWATGGLADTSVSGLRFLTIDQALADLAQFIEYVKSENFENGRYAEAKVALVGCSYAGTIATWMRLAYPHLVNAAFSDSGPLLAQEDFPEYLETVETAIKEQGGEECLSSISEAMEGLVNILATPTGPATVSQMFNTCSQINVTEPLDLATFFWFGITETFAYLVQYATPGDIPEACEVLTNSAVANQVQRLANWITSQEWTQPCIETSYKDVVAAHTDTSYNSSAAEMRLWTYQTCVEFGWYQTTSSTQQPFLTTVPLEYFHQMCKDFFSTYFDKNLLHSGIERMNLFFGGSYLPDRVVTVLGGHDPWTPMGPKVENARILAPVHLVPGISHCRAIQSTNSSETPELEETKELVLEQMQHFVLNTWPGPGAGASGLHASLALLVATTAYYIFM